MDSRKEVSGRSNLIGLVIMDGETNQEDGMLLVMFHRGEEMKTIRCKLHNILIDIREHILCGILHAHVYYWGADYWNGGSCLRCKYCLEEPYDYTEPLPFFANLEGEHWIQRWFRGGDE